MKTRETNAMELIKIYNWIKKRVDDTGAQYFTFGIFGSLNYPIYYFIWTHVAPQPCESPILRTIATLLCLGLVFYRFWPKKIKPIIPVYWYVTLTFCLPFFFTYMLFRNDINTIWLMNTIVVIFFLILLVDWLSFLILQSIGLFSGLFAYVLMTPHPLTYNSDLDYMGAIITYIVSIIIGVIFAHNKKAIEEVKLNGIKTIGTSIAHELRTPLETIRLCAIGIKRHLHHLIESYYIAQNRKLAIPPMDEDILKRIPETVDVINLETEAAFAFIDMLLMNVKQQEGVDNLSLCSMHFCIEQALKRYPFKGKQRNIIKFEKNNQDFMFLGNEWLC